jgi:hypothetical protein
MRVTRYSLTRLSSLLSTIELSLSSVSFNFTDDRARILFKVKRNFPIMLKRKSRMRKKKHTVLTVFFVVQSTSLYLKYSSHYDTIDLELSSENAGSCSCTSTEVIFSWRWNGETEAYSVFGIYVRSNAIFLRPVAESPRKKKRDESENKISYRCSGVPYTLQRV